MLFPPQLILIFSCWVFYIFQTYKWIWNLQVKESVRWHNIKFTITHQLKLLGQSKSIRNTTKVTMVGRDREWPPIILYGILPFLNLMILFLNGLDFHSFIVVLRCDKIKVWCGNWHRTHLAAKQGGPVIVNHCAKDQIILFLLCMCSNPKRNSLPRTIVFVWF